ncbi:hypothetical protein HZS_6229 [Henneguya salminicola]|nr:hypothetical protein HZS_6229 [Henneguya salminicola]
MKMGCPFFEYIDLENKLDCHKILTGLQMNIISTPLVMTNLYVTSVYVLLTGKRETLCCNIFHEIILQMKYLRKHRYITVDFEKNLIKVWDEEFFENILICCLFHFKQGSHRKLTKKII